MGLFISNLVSDPFFFFSWTIGISFSICVHEYAHAAVALRLGDDTAARAGHLTLNPLVQMGPVSLVMLMAMGIAWGSVPVSHARLRTPGSRAIVSFAGPASNLLICIAAGFLAVVYDAVAGGGVASPAYYFLRLASVANGVLFVFNMLPVPMFDGWSIFALAAPRMENLPPQQAQTISLLVLVLAFTTGLFDFVWGLGTALALGMMRVWTLLPGLGA